MNEVTVFKALADPTRLKILECVKNGEKCICAIIPGTGKSQPNVSQHLKVLKIAGLIDERKEGTRILIKASNPEIFALINSVKQLR
jgi:ArsR family transcriptional regulator